MTTKFRFLMVDEDYSIKGTNDEKIARAVAATGVTTIDLEHKVGDCAPEQIDLSMMLAFGEHTDCSIKEETNFVL